MLRKIFGVLFMVLLLTHAVAARQGDVNWRATRTRHFIIYYANQSTSVAAQTSVSAEKWYADLSLKLGFAPGGVTPVYLYPDRISFSRDTGVGRADTIVGLAGADSIRVDASGVFADVEQVLAHEMVHVFIARRLHGYTMRLPLWMHEGLAQYLTDDWDESSLTILQDAASTGRILSLESITTRFPEDQQGRAIAYAQSYSIVKYIADKHYPESLQYVIDETKRGGQFDKALFYSIGIEPEELEREWRQFIWERYGMQRWFQLGAGIISAAMVLFAILAFLSRIRQKRRKAEEFEEEAAGNAPRRGGLPRPPGTGVPPQVGGLPRPPVIMDEEITLPESGRPLKVAPTEEETRPPRRFPTPRRAPRRSRSGPRSGWLSRRARTSDETDSPD